MNEFSSEFWLAILGLGSLHLLGGAYGFFVGFKSYFQRRLFFQKSIAEITSATPGQVSFIGYITANNPLTSPSGASCVYVNYEATKTPTVKHNKPGFDLLPLSLSDIFLLFKPLEKKNENVLFILEDDNGTILIDPSHAKIDAPTKTCRYVAARNFQGDRMSGESIFLARKPCDDGGFFTKSSERSLSFVGNFFEQHGFYPSLMLDIFLWEKYLEIGDVVLVLGTLAKANDSSVHSQTSQTSREGFFVRAKKIFFISPNADTEASLSSKVKWGFIWGYYGVGAGLIMVALALVCLRDWFGF